MEARANNHQLFIEVCYNNDTMCMSENYDFDYQSKGSSLESCLMIAFSIEARRFDGGATL